MAATPDPPCGQPGGPCPLAGVVVAQGKVTVVSLRGELDLATHGQASRLLSAAIETASRSVVVDLSGLTFCDAAGMRLFRSARAQALDAEVALVLAAPTTAVSRPVSLFPVGSPPNFDTVRAAIQRCSPDQPAFGATVRPA